jgi:hypothetical protein
MGWCSILSQIFSTISQMDCVYPNWTPKHLPTLWYVMVGIGRAWHQRKVSSMMPKKFLICLTEASLSGNEASKLQPFLSCHFDIQCTIVIYEGALTHIHDMNLVISFLQVHRTSTKLFSIQGSKLWPSTVWHKKSYTCNMDMAPQPRWRGCSCWFCHSV